MDTTIDPELGCPLGPYQPDGEVMRRSFSRGALIVNPTDQSVCVDLKGLYRTESGAPVRSVVIAPHSHVFVLRADGATDKNG